MAQPRREAMAARGGLSHLLDNFEDLRRPSSPSGLGPRFSSSSGWMDSPSWIRCEPFISRWSHRSKGRPNCLGNGLGRPAHGPRPAGLPSFGTASVSTFACRLLASSRVMSFMIAPLWMSLSCRYLRGKDRIWNPSLNLHLLCLFPKYLDLIFVGLVLWALLEDGCAWMGFESTWALVLPLGFGLRLSPC